MLSVVATLLNLPFAMDIKETFLISTCRAASKNLLSPKQIVPMLSILKLLLLEDNALLERFFDLAPALEIVSKLLDSDEKLRLGMPI